MAMITVHQWPDTAQGLAELRRVARGPVVDPHLRRRRARPALARRLRAAALIAERRRYPPIAEIGAALGGTTDVQEVPIPIDCVDGFTEAFYARPEAFLDPEVRRSQSAWGFVDADEAERGLERLRADLESGAWDERYGRCARSPSSSAR